MINRCLRRFSVDQKTFNPISKLQHVRLDLNKVLSDNMLPLLRQNIKNRKATYADVDLCHQLYHQHRHLLFEIDQLRQKRNQHANLAKQLILIQNDVEREKMLDQHSKVGKDFKRQVVDREKLLDQIEHELVLQALKLPNKTHLDSPVGDESKNQVIFERGTNRIGTFESHLDIAQRFDLLDFNNASKLTGSKFVFLKNEAALLEMALINWALQKVQSKGYTPVTTPDLVRQQVVEACGFQPRDPSSQVYHLQSNESNPECLIGTSEIPLAGMYANELLSHNQLPIKMCAFSHCFRREAGRGQESKGLYRLHQFSKVEMFALTQPSESDKVLMEFVDIQKEILDELQLPYRILNMSTEELGAAAYRKYDIEAWMPHRQDYGEVCSASNCTSYQSRRLNITYLGDQNSKHLVHTVNATALAVPRIIMTLLETNWDGARVKIPECLHRFLPFTEISRK